MNAARAIRRGEEAGFTHEQATTLATKDFVDLTGERVKTELGDRITSLIKWIAGIAIVQTASIIFGTVGLIEILNR